ncbi:hypothetical protein OKA05_21400 [Luteolibacter arcticus]|uniref:Uncharacterized protein n=1 Tax=Luteolibacter arcticus TaxID=1581411 RepID=A0ABT3GNU3_9BACT|nr:hypothetical protein [Luteolibacter arcticus]MCW1925130.1 hypothetical protein [Luteolibacter arcticus]
MKPVVAIATALLSFAAGWVLKPTPDAVPDGSTAENGTTKSTGSGRGGEGDGSLDGKSHVRAKRPLVLPARGGGAVEPDAATVSAQVRFQETFGNASGRADNARLSRLAEALGLSAEQRETLAVLLANRRDGFRELQGGGSNPAESVQQASLSEQRFMEDVKKLLDPEQVAALDDFKQREKDNDIEAKAQRDVADLIGQVDLSEEQREQALEVMRRLSTTAASNRPAGWSLMNESFGMLGNNQVSVLEDLGGVMNDPAVMNDPQEIQRRLIEAQRATAGARVSALTAILTPGQLAQYRATLEARSSMMEAFTPPPLNPPR